MFMLKALKSDTLSSSLAAPTFAHGDTKLSGDGLQGVYLLCLQFLVSSSIRSDRGTGIRRLDAVG